MKHILITGGSGLVGKRLTQLLLDRGYKVSHLNRRAGKNNSVPVYAWNVEKRVIDDQAIIEADAVIHLAGEGIADKRWTSKRKKEIAESRITGTALLSEALKKIPNHVKVVVSASAIGYYGHRPTELLREYDAPNNDFLAMTCQLWEAEANKITDQNIRVACIRTGVVLAKDGGALLPLSKMIKRGLGSVLGNGKQWMSWIHLDDLCRIYIKAIEDDSMNGPYNAVAPHPVTNKEFTKTLARALHRPLLLPPAPAFILQLTLGEMAGVILDSTKVSSEKMESTGFDFEYTQLELALNNIYGK